MQHQPCADGVEKNGLGAHNWDVASSIHVPKMQSIGYVGKGENQDRLSEELFLGAMLGQVRHCLGSCIHCLGSTGWCMRRDCHGPVTPLQVRREDERSSDAGSEVIRGVSSVQLRLGPSATWSQHPWPRQLELARGLVVSSDSAIESSTRIAMWATRALTRSPQTAILGVSQYGDIA